MNKVARCGDSSEAIWRDAIHRAAHPSGDANWDSQAAPQLRDGSRVEWTARGSAQGQ